MIKKGYYYENPPTREEQEQAFKAYRRIFCESAKPSIGKLQHQDWMSRNIPDSFLVSNKGILERTTVSNEPMFCGTCGSPFLTYADGRKVCRCMGRAGV